MANMVFLLTILFKKVNHRGHREKIKEIFVFISTAKFKFFKNLKRNFGHGNSSNLPGQIFLLKILHKHFVTKTNPTQIEY